jgi:hypothetical protein
VNGDQLNVWNLSRKWRLKMASKILCYFLHGCKWEKKDGKRHNPCLAPDSEPCCYKHSQKERATQTDKIKEAIEARDKDWIAWGEGQCPHDKDLVKRRCTYCWAERKESTK